MHANKEQIPQKQIMMIEMDQQNFDELYYQ